MVREITVSRLACVRLLHLGTLITICYYDSRSSAEKNNIHLIPIYFIYSFLYLTFRTDNRAIKERVYTFLEAGIRLTPR